MKSYNKHIRIPIFKAILLSCIVSAGLIAWLRTGHGEAMSARAQEAPAVTCSATPPYPIPAPSAFPLRAIAAGRVNQDAVPGGQPPDNHFDLIIPAQAAPPLVTPKVINFYGDGAGRFCQPANVINQAPESLLFDNDKPIHILASDPENDFVVESAGSGFHTDIAVASAGPTPGSSTVTVYPGLGTGNFPQTSVGNRRVIVGTISEQPSVGVPLVAGDFVSDSSNPPLIDFAVIADNTVKIVKQNSDGSLSLLTPLTMPPNFHPFSIAAGNLNNFGIKDIVVVADNSTDVVVFYDGATTPTVSSGVLPGNARFVTVGQFNSQAGEDLAITTASGIKILFGTSFAFTSGPTLSATSPGYIVTGDFDGDTKADIAAITNTDSVTVFKGDGEGNFLPPANYFVGNQPVAMVAVKTGSFPNFPGPQFLAILQQTSKTISTVFPNRLQFYPLPSPVRLLETRSGFPGCTNPGAQIIANGTLTLPARTACAGIPASAAAVTGNITVIPSEPGFLTLFPSTVAQPPVVANSNFQANEITNNVFTVALGANDGAFKIFTNATTHAIVDVTGYYAPPGTGGLYFHPLPSPVRLLETRAGFSGCIAPGAPLTGTGNPNADPNLDLLLQGRSPIASPCNSIPASAQVLVGNATSVTPGSSGYLTIYPSGGTRPTVASSNYAGNDVINGPFAVKLGADGKFKVYTFATTHLVIDILGYYSEDAIDANGAGMLFSPLQNPVRLLETRFGSTLTGCTRPEAPILGNLTMATHTQSAAGFCGLSSDTQALVGNVTVVNAMGAGFLTFFPANLLTPPLVATSNYPSPATFGYNRHYFVGLSPTDGKFKILTQFTTDLVVDVSGYFVP